VKESARCVDREGPYFGIYLVFVIDGVGGVVVVLEGDTNNSKALRFQ
jgi:hypothetical protein